MGGLGGNKGAALPPSPPRPAGPAPLERSAGVMGGALAQPALHASTLIALHMHKPYTMH